MAITTDEILKHAMDPKQCSKCGRWLINADFNISRRKADGRYNICRDCSKDEYYIRRYGSRTVQEG